MIAVTGATGQLGRLVIEKLLEKRPASQLIAAVRTPEKATALGSKGVHVRRADYDVPDTLASAFEGVDELLLISANELGKRDRQHAAVIAAARTAGVKLLVYTSLLHADTSTLSLADEHRTTEGALRASAIPTVILRNGFYLENYTERLLGPALERGALMGAAKEGQIAAAARADYAAAAVTILTAPGHAGRVYELAGDRPFTMTELAAEVARAAGTSIVYRDMEADEYVSALTRSGLPAPVARLFADADEAIARGELDDRSGELHRLIGRATATLRDAVEAGVKHARTAAESTR